MEEQDDDQSSTHSFSVVDKMFGHSDHQEEQDEAPLKSTLEEPHVKEIAKVAYLDFSIGIYQNIHVPANGPRRFYHDPVVMVDPKSVKSEANELCFKVKMGDHEIRALVLARLLSLESLANVNIQLNDISTMPYEEIRLLVKPGTVLKSIKLKEEPIPYYIRMKDSLDFHLKCEFSSVAAELVGDFKKSPEFVMDNWMLALECKGLALGSGCKPLEVMSVTKIRPTWVFPVATLPRDVDQEARTQSVIENLPPRLKGCEALIESLKNEIKGYEALVESLKKDIKDLQTKQQKDVNEVDARFCDIEDELQEMATGGSDAARKEVMAKQIKGLEAELQRVKCFSSATDDRTLGLEEKLTTLSNKKLPTAIPIFAVRKCINPSAAARQSFGYAAHDFDMKTQHGQIDLPTGVFTVQTPGIYQLNFTSIVRIDGGHMRHYFELRVDGVFKGSSLNMTELDTRGYRSVAISALLQLNADQKVGVFVESGQLYECDPGTLFSATLFVDQ